VNIILVLFAYLALSLFYPNMISAQESIIINEVMYDLEGSDSDREWIELKNVGEQSVDLSNWKFEESGTQHKLTSYQGTLNLDPQQYAVIVDKVENFLADFPGFSGTIFDSSFSLSNSGETLNLRDSKDGEIVSELTYSSDLGASGDGNSLQRNENGNFIPAIPTPGKSNQSKAVPSPIPSPAASEQESNQDIPRLIIGSPNSPNPIESPVNISSSKSDKPSHTLGANNEATPSLSPSPPSSSQLNEDKDTQQTKINTIIMGLGIIVIGLALALYVVYNRKFKSKEHVQ